MTMAFNENLIKKVCVSAARGKHAYTTDTGKLFEFQNINSHYHFRLVPKIEWNLKTNEIIVVEMEQNQTIYK